MTNMSTETNITADSKIQVAQYCKDLWNYRDLFWAFLERDLKTRYRQTILGVLWVLIPPLVNCGVFYVIFVRVFNMPTQNLPSLLFFLAALIPWTCFSNGISQAASSLESSAGLISKVYFPRMIVPMATLFTTIFDFMIGWTFFNLIAIFFGLWTWWFIPCTVVFLGLQLGTSMGLGLLLAILNAQYRDVRYVIPWLIQLGMWVTPVVWSTERLLNTRFEKQFVIFLYLNPMAGVIESYRSLLGGTYLPFRLLAINIIVMLVILVVGISVFRSREQKIVDML